MKMRLISDFQAGVCLPGFRPLCVILLAIFGLAFPTLAAPGNLDTGFDPNVSGGVNSIFATAVQPDTKIPIGGSFWSVGSTQFTLGNIARLIATGSLDSTVAFDPGTGTENTVYSLAVQPDGKILIAGYFSGVNGQPNTARIARLNTNGSVDGSFNPGTGPNDAVYGMAVQSDGKIVIVGLFTQVNGQARNYVARLNPNGSVESTASFNPGTGANDHIYTAAVQPDGKILLGGNFTTMNGLPRTRIARLLPDGSVESTATFDPGTGANNRVYCLAVQPDGRILLGGNFTTVNGQGRVRVARLHANGGVEETATFNPGGGADFPVTSVALQANGKIVLGGGFLNVNGQNRSGVARLGVDGNVEGPSTFDVGSGSDWDVNGVAIQADGGILIAGGFASFNGTPRKLMARLLNDSPTQTLSPAASGVVWQRGGAAPEVSQVTFEHSANGGSSWSSLGAATWVAGSWELTGLSLPSEGLIRARGRTIGGFYNGSSGIVEQVQFYVLPQAPAAATLAASEVIGTEATVHGTVNAQGSGTNIVFEYGTSTAYGQTSTGSPSPLADASPVAVGKTLTGLLTGTTYHFRVKATNTGGVAVGADLTFTTLTSIEDWRRLHFGNSANLGEGEDFATPDDDGICNLLKYGLVLTPGTSAVSVLPVSQRRTYPEGDRLALTFTRNPARNDITVQVQASDRVGGPWTEVLAGSVNGAAMAGPGLVREIDADGGRKTVEVRDTVNMSASPRRFLRIHVTR